jgi:hypothetical protein
MEHRMLLSAVSPADDSAIAEDAAAETQRGDFGSWVFATSDLGSERKSGTLAETAMSPYGPLSQRFGAEMELNSESSMLQNSSADETESTAEHDALQTATQEKSGDVSSPEYTWPATLISGFRAETTVSPLVILQQLAARNSPGRNSDFRQILNSTNRNQQLQEKVSHQILADTTDADDGSSDNLAISSDSQQAAPPAEFSRVIDSAESLTSELPASPETGISIEQGLEELWPDILSPGPPQRTSQHVATQQAKKTVQRVQHVEVEQAVEDQHIAKKIEFAGGVSHPTPVVIRAGATRNSRGENPAGTDTPGDEDSVPILASECLKSEWWTSDRESTVPEIRPLQAEIR